MTGRRSTSFKIGNSRNTPYGKDMYFVDFFINNGRICIGFFADNLKKGTKTTYLNGFLEK